jgi:hypothetical protein
MNFKSWRQCNTKKIIIIKMVQRLVILEWLNHPCIKKMIWLPLRVSLKWPNHFLWPRTNSAVLNWQNRTKRVVWPLHLCNTPKVYFFLIFWVFLASSTAQKYSIALRYCMVSASDFINTKNVQNVKVLTPNLLILKT